VPIQGTPKDSLSDEETMEEEKLNPRRRYFLDGKFDPDSYNDDLVAYSDFFDDNGWPLFGEFDPYSLVNPISQIPWHQAPRIPTISEINSEYWGWYRLLEDFNRVTDELSALTKQSPQEFKSKHRGTGDGHYLPKSLTALEGNVTYITRHIIPKLKILIAKRQHTIQLTILWGELQEIVSAFQISLDYANRHLKAVRAAKTKAPQLKWYLHVRQHHESMGLSANAINLRLGLVVASIVRGNIPVPDGFTKEWFRATQQQSIEKGKPRVYSRGLSDAFRRSKSDARAAELLKSLPHEEPIIPPIDLGFYEGFLKKQ
jgi:hypothetical protein